VMIFLLLMQKEELLGDLKSKNEMDFLIIDLI
jgi:hypothetical protein